jgi:hypothetical protein
MGKLNDLSITIGTNNKAEIVFDSLFPNFLEIKYDKPSEYIQKYWNAYLLRPERNNNLNGKLFEYILATLCIREGIIPIYMSAKVAFVPNVIYDLMFYTKERGPICWNRRISFSNAKPGWKMCFHKRMGQTSQKNLQSKFWRKTFWRHHKRGN